MNKHKQREQGCIKKTKALQIKKWRKQGYTWRAITWLASEKWPEDDICNGNQIDGMILCREAGEILNENDNDW